MSQSRNLTKDMMQIENIYQSVLEETYKHAEVSHDKKDIVPIIKNTGPKAADNFKADKVDTEDLTDNEEENNVYEPSKFSQKSGKVAKESINNSVMSNDNIFDKLYKTVMEGEEVENFDIEDTGEIDDTPEEVGEETISVQLSPMHVEALLDLLAQVEEQLGDEEGGDELEDFDDEEEDDFLAEAPTALETAPDGVSKLTGKNNKVGNLKAKGGQADSGSVKEDGDPKPAADGVAKLTSTAAGSNKVGATGEWGG
jgi:hypothetical protein